MPFCKCARLLVATAAAIAFFGSPVAPAQDAELVNVGRNVGDGQVAYDIPFDPKNVTQMTFVAPTVRHPYYEVVVPFGDWSDGASATVDKVRVNGVSVDSFYIFVDGFSHVQSGWITRDSKTAKNVVLVARTVWHNGKPTTVEVDVTRTGEPAKITRSFTGAAPGKGGGPEGWRRYQTVALHEKAGIDRKNEPVECSLVARAEDCADIEKELRLFAVGDAGELQPVAMQTFNAKRFPGRPAGTSNDFYLQHPSQSVEAVFLASVPAKKARVYAFFYDNPAAEAPVAPQTDLVVTGPPVGAKVENQYFVAQLDQRCGQIASFVLKGREERPVPPLTNSLSRAVHWNPDSYSDNGQWGHTFSWDPPDETTVTTRGPILFRVTNRGRMPGSTPQVYVSVTYSFYAGVPYVRTSTVTEVRDALNADAIRNGEIVLDSHLVTHFVWEEKNGKILKMPTLHGPNWQDEWATRVDHDVPWLALTNELDDYGIGAIVEDSMAFNPNSGEATTHRPAYYLYYHHFWETPLTYFTRAWVYPFSDYQRGPILPVAAGSTYIEKMDFMPFLLHKKAKRYQEIAKMSEQLRQPLTQAWGR